MRTPVARVKLELRPLVVRVRHAGLTDADVFLASYPRSGNTWAKFLLAGLLSGQDVSFGSSEEVVPMVGRHRDAPRLLPDGGRLIKTHEPYRHEYRKAIYLVRDFRDVVISYFRIYVGPGVPSPDFIAKLVVGEVPYGSWVHHVESWMDASQGPARILIVRYEDFVSRTAPILRKIADFLGVAATDRELAEVIEWNTVARMRKKAEADVEFARKVGWTRGASAVGSGSVGGWRTEFGEPELEALAPVGPILARLGYF
jgi:hypothetical protein